MRRRIQALLGTCVLGFGLLVGGCTLGQGQAPAEMLTQRTDAVPFLAGQDFARTDNGLRITGTTRLSDRSYRVYLATDAVSSDAFAEGNSIVVTLPRGYVDTTRYPVLYLLNGSGTDGDAMQWFTRGDVEAVLGDSQAIAVMPDGGNAGWYTNWKSAPNGARDFQSLHLDELVPWIDGHLPTLATRGSRAIGGVSMGGFGAISYAEARPDLFSQAFSFSGILDFGAASTRELIDQQAVAAGAGPGAVFGKPVTGTENPWAVSDPTRHAGELEAAGIHLVAGAGTPSADPQADNPQHLEYLVRQSTEAFAQELGRQGIQYDLEILDGTTPGCDGGHNWGCWTPAAAQLVPRIVSGLEAREESPSK